MPIPIVDLLEMVNVHRQHCIGQLVAHKPFAFAIEHILEPSAVEQAREHVMV